MFNNKYAKWGAVLLVLVSMHFFFGLFPFSNTSTQANVPYISYSTFHEQVEKGQFTALVQESGSNKIVGTRPDKSTVYTTAPDVNDIMSVAQKNKIDIEIKDPPPPTALTQLLGIFVYLLPILIIIGFSLWMHKRATQMSIKSMGGGLSQMAQGKSKNVIDPKDNPYRLKDVAGIGEMKTEVSEIIDFLKNPEVYQRVGARAPKGILMAGPPGTGKTLLAKAIAGESGVPFFSASGSDFMEMFVGVGASRVRNLFETAKKSAPAIIFIDEIDSVGRSRSQHNYGTDERDQTLNALLVEMDGFSPNTNVVVIAATNRAELLDEALTRPGRFDREVTMSLPDLAGRTEILEVHGKKVPVANDVVWKDVARGTPGFSGAELANLVNEAAVLAAREKNTLVFKTHFNEARDKILMGVQRGPLKNEQERTIVAYHEAGHAIVAHFTENSEPVHKISIMPRGRALGVTIQLPKEDSYNHSQKKLLGDISILMGGRAAEDVVLGQRTVGASNDFMRATVLARRMIASWGMDPEFGPFSVDGETGHDWAQHNVWSEKTKQDVDNRVQTLLKSHYDQACELLRTHHKALEAVAQALLEKETLEAEEFEEIVARTETVRPPTPIALDKTPQ